MNTTPSTASDLPPSVKGFPNGRVQLKSVACGQVAAHVGVLGHLIRVKRYEMSAEGVQTALEE